MRIGELARTVGVSTDTVRFYERSGLLPRPARRDNDYREYSDSDADHLRLLTDLRRLDIPLEEAARIAGWCHSGHCPDSASRLPMLVAERRATIAERIAGLKELDQKLAGLERHIRTPRRSLSVLASGACCDAASAVTEAGIAGCDCCASSSAGGGSAAPPG